MENDFRLIRPGTFVDGEEYLLKEQLADETVLVPVTFVAYDPSPAFVIVRNGTGRQRCLRDDLFACPDISAGSLIKPTIIS